jgi:hypothetical protein
MSLAWPVLSWSVSGPAGWLGLLPSWRRSTASAKDWAERRTWHGQGAAADPADGDSDHPGWEMQKPLVTELCQLRKLPDESVPDPDPGLAALRFLKELALDQKLFVDQEQTEAEQRAQEARRQQAALAARAEKMAELQNTFQTLAMAGEDPRLEATACRPGLGIQRPARSSFDP